MEAIDHDKADPAGHPKAHSRRAEPVEPGAAGAAEPVQKQPGGVPQEGARVCAEPKEEKLRMLIAIETFVLQFVVYWRRQIIRSYKTLIMRFEP